MLARGDLQELRVADLEEREVPPHREVRTVDLEHESGPVDRIVLLCHEVGEARQIRVTARVVLVLQEVRDDAGRRRRHERVGWLGRLQRCLEVRYVLLDRRAVLPLDRPVARRPHDRRAPLTARGRLGEVGPVRPHGTAASPSKPVRRWRT